MGSWRCPAGGYTQDPEGSLYSEPPSASLGGCWGRAAWASRGIFFAAPLSSVLATCGAGRPGRGQRACGRAPSLGDGGLRGPSLGGQLSGSAQRH